MKDALGTRMKEQYEFRARTFLPRRTWTILRLDGKAFHTYTRGLLRPFDHALMDDMAHTARFLGYETGIYTKIDELWLDFDLGGVFGQVELFDTAMPVALWLAELAFYGAPYPIDRIVIHTMNPVGREAMKSLLQRYGYNVVVQLPHFHI